jgi:hypothetical protein
MGGDNVASLKGAEKMSRSEYERLLNQGRKAGLNARELNAALSANAPAQDGRPDSNGYVWVMDENGRLVFRPAQEGKS